MTANTDVLGSINKTIGLEIMNSGEIPEVLQPHLKTSCAILLGQLEGYVNRDASMNERQVLKFAETIIRRVNLRLITTDEPVPEIELLQYATYINSCRQ